MEIIIQLVFELIFQVPAIRIFALTVVPALLLLRYVRSKDRLEAESPGLVWSLVGLGAVAVVLSMVLEIAGIFALSRVFPIDSTAFTVLHWFLVVGLAEEGSKYLMLRLRTWNHVEFNCLFDGMVYAVAVSAGFALVENVMYLFRYGPSVVFLRAIGSIPGHICVSVFMGTWYSAAKKYQYWGNQSQVKKCQWLSVLVPAGAHGGFDLLASGISSGLGIVVFIAYIIVIFVVSFRLIKNLSEKDDFYSQTKAEA